MNKAIAVFIGGALMVALTLGSGLYFSFANGYVLGRLWDWYAVPLGMRAIGWSTFAGLMLAVGIFRQNSDASKTAKDSRELTEKIGSLIGLALSPWALLLVGWLLK